MVFLDSHRLRPRIHRDGACRWAETSLVFRNRHSPTSASASLRTKEALIESDLVRAATRIL